MKRLAECTVCGHSLVFEADTELQAWRQLHPHPRLVTSEALMFAEKAGIPWPEERSYEQTLDEGERHD